jgi:glycosyltransferase involved in cell wall biosynthesis
MIEPCMIDHPVPVSVVNNKTPQVSIGMPVFNGEKYIREALDSLLRQTFTDFELIISDNASTDGTEAICRSFSVKDSRIRYIRQVVNLGAAANFELVLVEAVGKYFMWAAYDDLRTPDFIEVLFKMLEQDEKNTSAFGIFKEINDDGKYLGKEHILNFSGANSFDRIRKFWLDDRSLRDVWIYGLHRRSILPPTYGAPWPWPNRDNPINSAYPILTFLLTKGSYCFNSDKVIFYRRVLKLGSLWRKELKYSNIPLREFKHLLLKSNLILRSVSEATKGSGSVFIGFLAFFFVTLNVARGITRRYLNSFKRVFFKKAGNDH